jgi:hypothetical protein
MYAKIGSRVYQDNRWACIIAMNADSLHFCYSSTSVLSSTQPKRKEIQKKTNDRLPHSRNIETIKQLEK